MAEAEKNKIKDEYVKIKMNHSFLVDMRSDSELKAMREEIEKLKKTNRKEFLEAVKLGPDNVPYLASKGEVIEVSKTWYENYKDHTVEISIHLDSPAYKRTDGGAFPFNTTEAKMHGHIRDDKSTMQRIKLFDLVEG